MNIKFFLVWIAFSFNYLEASEASPLQYTVSTFGSDYILHMGESDAEGKTTANIYKIDDKGINLCWNTQATYVLPERVLFAFDGETIVIVRTVFYDEIKQNPVLIEIHKKGKATKLLRLSMFIDDVKKLQRNVFKLNQAQVLMNDKESFILMDKIDLNILYKNKFSNLQESLFLKIETSDGKSKIYNLNTLKLEESRGKLNKHKRTE